MNKRNIIFILILIVLIGGGVYYYDYNVKVVSCVSTYPPEKEKEIFGDLSKDEIFDVLFKLSKTPTDEMKKSLENEYKKNGYDVDFSQIKIKQYTKRDLKAQEKIKENINKK